MRSRRTTSISRIPSGCIRQGILCPVLPEALTAILERRTRAISATAFEFISTTRQIQKVRTFASTLPETLMT
jgi:hypothetical protein